MATQCVLPPYRTPAMTKVKNGAVYYVKQPEDHIVPGEHLKYVEEEIDLDNVPLNGGVLLQTLYLSADPYLIYRMRDPSIDMFCPPMLIGDVVDNAGVGRVIRSDDPKFKAGDLVYAYLEFREYHVYPGSISHFYKFPLAKIEPLPNLPLSIYVGTLGMPGTTAYQGLKGFALDALRSKEVDGKTVHPTMFVSGGAGPVGTFVIEYAKHLNPHVKIIASAGSAAKVDIMRSVGADVAFNYKEEDPADVLRREGPLDIYWDNVAGPTLDAALLNFKRNGLIIACGAISQASSGDAVVRHFEEIFQRNLTVKGFIVYTGEAAHLCAGFHDEVIPLALQGKITSREHRYRGLKEGARALADLHHGHNTGKAVIVVHEE